MKKISTLFLFVIFFALFSVSFFAMLMGPVWGTKDYEEYQKKIDTFPLPDNFTYYEDISFLGEYEYFQGNRATDYYYKLKAVSGETILFLCGIPHYREHDPEYYPEVADSPSEMETLRFREGGKGQITINGCKFLYSDEDLGELWWQDSYGTKLIVLPYGVPKGEFWDQLMNPESVEIALEQLFRATKTELPDPDTSTDTATTDAIPSDGENTSFPWLWIALPVGAVVIAGGAAFALLRKKRRTKSEI